VKLLHTSDWHVGKQIRGNSRADEHRAVLSEIVEIAAVNAVDLVLVAGDLFETAAPSPEAEQIVYRALLELAETGAHLAIISGNHDNARRLEAVSPMLEAIGDVHALTKPVSASQGGVRRFEVGTGEEVVLGLLPFVSKRGIVRASDLWDNEAFESSQLYSDRVSRMISSLAESFTAETVNLLMAHTFVHGSTQGGGERQAHFIEEYAITAPMLPSTANYIALGHVHKPQKIKASSPTHYCGSPLQMDFGEKGQVKQVNLVDISVGSPGKVEAVKLTSGTPLIRLKGTFDEVIEAAASVDGPAWLQVVVDEPQRAGLADDIRERIGDHVVDIRVLGAMNAKAPVKRSQRIGRSPVELFDEFLAEENVEDERIAAGFARLLDEENDNTGEVVE